MLDSTEKEYLESLINYYKTKTVQLEYDFVAYKIKTEQDMRQANKLIQDLVAKSEKDRLDAIYDSSKKTKLKRLKTKIVQEQKGK